MINLSESSLQRCLKAPFQPHSFKKSLYDCTLKNAILNNAFGGFQNKHDCVGMSFSPNESLLWKNLHPIPNDVWLIQRNSQCQSWTLVRLCGKSCSCLDGSGITIVSFDLCLKVFKQLVVSAFVSVFFWPREVCGSDNEAFFVLSFQHSLAQVSAGHLAHSVQNSFHLL